jgi:hypothetical protein
MLGKSGLIDRNDRELVGVPKISENQDSSMRRKEELWDENNPRKSKLAEGP